MNYTAVAKLAWWYFRVLTSQLLLNREILLLMDEPNIWF